MCVEGEGDELDCQCMAVQQGLADGWKGAMLSVEGVSLFVDVPGFEVRSLIEGLAGVQDSGIWPVYISHDQ